MKNQESLEKEYKGFKVKSNFVESLEEFVIFMETLVGDISENNSVARKEIKNNKRWKLEVRIRNLFLSLLNERELEAYDEDTEVLKDMASLDEEYLRNYERIISIATESNFKKLVKLVDFSYEYYLSHMDIYDKQREMLELEIRGIHLISPCPEDKREELDEFVKSKIKQLEQKVKQKKLVKKDS